MTNKYLDAGDNRARLVENLFAKIARRYDLLNDVMSFGMHRAWKRELVRRSGFDGKKRALDLCCGTGDIAFLLAARAMSGMSRTEEWGNGGMGEEEGNVQRSTSNIQHSTQIQAGTPVPPDSAPEGRRATTPREGTRATESSLPFSHSPIHLPLASVIGLDFAEPMLRLANARARVLQKHGHEAGLAFVRGDAMRLPFEDESFDVVTVGYGLRNIADMRQTLTEVHRVLKRGGIFLSLDMGKPPNAIWRKIYFTHLRVTLPIWGWLFFRDPDCYRYLWDSLEIYSAQEGVKKTMADVGFLEASYKNFCGGAMGLNFGSK